MKLNISISPTAVLFEFDTPRDRDVFWKGMEKSGFVAQGASSRLGTRGINIVTAKIKTAYAWPFEAIPSSGNGNVPITQVEKKADELIGLTSPTRPLPSQTLTQVQVAEPPPNIPIPQLTEVPASPTATTEAQPVAAPAATTTTPPKDDPEPTGIHKNSREYRNWKARQAK